MAPKTSQLQIRVSEHQKATLKRLAATARMTVSAYVLSQVLPTRTQELDRIFGVLSGSREEHPAALAALVALVNGTDPADFPVVFDRGPLEPLPPILFNQVAALIERGAQARGLDVPSWVHEVPPLARPHFAWPLVSLRPHQIRVAPVAYKRRGIFFDPASQPVLTATGTDAVPTEENGSEALRRLEKLANALSSIELKVEFYLLGGALLSQSFHARPGTAHIDAQFRPESEAANAVGDLTQREGWPAGWLTDAVKEHLVGGIRPDRYIDLPSLAVFVPPLEYVLALKVAALRLGPGGRALDDLRYVLRALNLSDADEALALAGRYFGPRQIPSDARATLERLLGG